MNKYDKQALLLNNRTLTLMEQKFKLLATSIFKWEGLEKIGGNSEFLEKTLYTDGIACFVKDPSLGYLTLECLPSNYLNHYYEPTYINAIGNNYNKQYKASDCVIIKNNVLKLPTIEIGNFYASKLSNIDRTIDTHINILKTPIIIEGTSKDILTLENIINKYMGNSPVLFAKKGFDLSSKFNMLKTDIQYIIDKLDVHKHDVLNEGLTFLGINNANTDKKERLITSEVSSNENLVKIFLNSFYHSRKLACEEINNKFFDGKEIIKVSLNDDINNLLLLFENKEINNIEEENNLNEPLHNNS